MDYGCKQVMVGAHAGNRSKYANHKGKKEPRDGSMDTWERYKMEPSLKMGWFLIFLSLSIPHLSLVFPLSKTIWYPFSSSQSFLTTLIPTYHWPEIASASGSSLTSLEIQLVFINMMNTNLETHFSKTPRLEP